MKELCIFPKFGLTFIFHLASFLPSRHQRSKQSQPRYMPSLYNMDDSGLNQKLMTSSIGRWVVVCKGVARASKQPSSDVILVNTFTMNGVLVMLANGIMIVHIK